MSHIVNTILEIASSNIDNKQKHEDSKLKFANAMDWADEGKYLPPLGKIFGDFILEKNLVLFLAERGVGKSFFCLDLGLSIISGQKQFCGQEIEKAGNVLYIDWELGEMVMKLRLKDAVQTIEHFPHPYKMYMTYASNSLPELMVELQENIENYNPVLIIIDNLRTAFLGEDNEKNYKMSKAIMELKRLTSIYDTAILLVHHTRKGISGQESNSDMQSGAGSITDLIDDDFIMRQSKHGERLKTIKRMKSRHVISDFKVKLVEFNELCWFDLLEDDVQEGLHLKKLEDKKANKEDSDQRLKELTEHLWL